MKKLISQLTLSLLIVAVLVIVNGKEANAQGGRKVLQLSGIVLGEDSVAGLPGVHIYVPKAGRGTTTNRVGYFSLPVLEGDELIVSAIGYERQFFQVPKTDRDNLTIVVEMISDTTFLETVEIMPFPTEQIFKEAVLALNLPINPNEDVDVNEELLALMLQSVPMDGASNHQYYMDNWIQYQNDRYGPRSNPLLNPFNWANFFRSLRSKKK